MFVFAGTMRPIRFADDNIRMMLHIENLISATLNCNSKMKFGLIPSAWGNIKQDILRQASLAYELGFSSVMIAEHHGSVGFLPSPLITIAAISQHLPKMEIGTTAAIFPLYDPIRFAADCAVLDRLSDGRLIVGLVAGYRKSEFDLFNVSLKERGRRMDNGIKLISDLWEGREVFINRPGGVHPIRYHLELLPIQKPRPPIWIGGWAPKAVDRAVRLGDKLLAGAVGSFADVIATMRLYREMLQKAQKKFNGISLMRVAYVAETGEQALRDVEGPVQRMYVEGYSEPGHPLLKSGSMSMQDWVNDRFLVGTPSAIIESIARLQKEGVDNLILRMALPGLSEEKILQNIKMFGEKILSQKGIF